MVYSSEGINNKEYIANLHLSKEQDTRGKVLGLARWTLPYLNIVHIPGKLKLGPRFQGI